MSIKVNNTNKLENIEDLPNGTAFVFASTINTDKDAGDVGHFGIKLTDNSFVIVRSDGDIDKVDTINPTGHSFDKWQKVIRAKIKSVELEIG